jgi:hypothetical protein
MMSKSLMISFSLLNQGWASASLAVGLKSGLGLSILVNKSLQFFDV